MNTRRIDEGLIGLLALGKSAELGRQLVLTTDKKFAEKVAGKIKANPETLQQWGPGYVAFDAVISVTGVLAMFQAIRKNRKGAGTAGLVQGITLVAYSLYYLAYSLFALKGTSFPTKLIHVGASLGHGYQGFRIIKFSRKAFK
jgi:hypothetical protein